MSHCVRSVVPLACDCASSQEMSLKESTQALPVSCRTFPLFFSQYVQPLGLWMPDTHSHFYPFMNMLFMKACNLFIKFTDIVYLHNFMGQ